MNEYFQVDNRDSLSEQTAAGVSFKEEENNRAKSEEIPEKQMKKSSRRGRRPAKVDVKSKLERSRQSARECRARKKLRYQYLEEIVTNRETAITALREELNMYKKWSSEVDAGAIPEGLTEVLDEMEQQSTTVDQHQP